MKETNLKREKEEIDNLVKLFFSIFTNKGKPAKIETLKQLCTEKIIISKNTIDQTEINDLETFIKPRIIILTNGKLVDFEEIELSETTVIKNNIAQRVSEYRKKGILNGNEFSETGTKMFQFLKIEGHWKISSLIWNDN